MDIYLKNYRFKIDPGQNKDYWDRINSDVWEPFTFVIFDYFITEESTVLDLGSWAGVLTLYAAMLSKEVHAVDPDPVCFEELQANISLNPLIANKVKTYKKAISDKKTLVRLSARERYGRSSSSILVRRRDKENALEIETITLFDFLLQEDIGKVDFIKMDVEGAEFKILRSIGKVIEKYNYPTLYVSFHYNYLRESLYGKYIFSRILNKIIFRLEKMLSIDLLKSKISKDISNLFDQVKSYKYIYKTDGELVSIEKLENEILELIKSDLVFTNTEWNPSSPDKQILT